MKPTDQPLAEMMGMGEYEIAQRLHALDFTDADRANLRRLSPHVAKRLSETVERFYELQLSDADTPARIGGDEFCLVMPRATEAEASGVLERIVQAFDLRNRRGAVTLSGGVAQAGPDDFPAAPELLRQADGLMYLAKREVRRGGGHRFRFPSGRAVALTPLLADPVPAE